MKKENTEKMLEEFRPAEPREPEQLKKKCMADFDKQSSKSTGLFRLVAALTATAAMFMFLVFIAPSFLLNVRSGVPSTNADNSSGGSGGGLFNYDFFSSERSGNAPPAMTSAPGMENMEEHSQERETTDRTGDNYTEIRENRFVKAFDKPFSTFGVDVDTASYTIARSYLEEGTEVPPEAVRIEEFVNYFSYDYPEPDSEHPFSVTTEMATCPWNPSNKLMLVGIQGKHVDVSDVPPSNVVFLIDVSGSMSDELRLVKQSLDFLIEKLRPEDQVAIVVYAGASGLVLDSTPGFEKEKIRTAIQGLASGGSTAGAEGITLAYKVASENFIEDGNNRVVLITDGDFNVGISSDAALKKLIEEKRESGVFLSCLGVGRGNYQDAKMEKLADNGNGNYAYIDRLSEAKRVFQEEFTSTMLTIAKDVKIQLEFNPAFVKRYRLLGYENRILAKEDFEDDKKDAGELGSGHSVTALYEVVPADGKLDSETGKYVQAELTLEAMESGEAGTLRLRYKEPDSKNSKLIERVLPYSPHTFEEASDNLRFASAVVEFALLLRNSDFAGDADAEHALETARSCTGFDPAGKRAEFLDMIISHIGLTR